jgi:hypothetical protein
LLGKGKKTKAWDRLRAKIKPKFFAVGITTCEMRWPGCKYDEDLGFAHAQKRNKVEDLSEVILVCNHCHDYLDNQGMSHEAMEAIVRDVIERRERQP